MKHGREMNQPAIVSDQFWGEEPPPPTHIHLFLDIYVNVIDCTNTYKSLFPHTQFHTYMHAAVDCGSLTNPVDGMVDTAGGTTLGNVAIYSCMDGYELNGSPIRVCIEDGKWNDMEPTCDGKSCLYFEISLVRLPGNQTTLQVYSIYTTP